MEESSPASGVTESERVLIKLCQNTFLSLWSYPNIYKDQFQHAKSGDGKEICDLLVVCGNDIVVFSDKRCKYGDSSNHKLNWTRWYRRAIQSSAKQLIGARRWINTYPSRIFTDKRCENPLPYDLPEMANARFHLVVVASGAKEACQNALNGSGSLILKPTVQGKSHVDDHADPFVVGDVSPGNEFVHVLDEVSLQVLLMELDTVTDFVDYLIRKERFIQSGKLHVALGEENLLAHYLCNTVDDIGHDFVVPDGVASVVVEDGLWNTYCESNAVIRKRDADQKSYLWDQLIEHFVTHVLNEALTHSTMDSLSDFEFGVRLMAKESRLNRRILADAWIDQLNSAPDDQVSIRTLFCKEGATTVYVFLRMPPAFVKIDVGYAEFRRKYLSGYLFTVPRKFPAAQWIVGIATDSDYHPDQSHDAAVLDVGKMADEDEKFADDLLNEFKPARVGGVRATDVHTAEYPTRTNPTGVKMKKPRRNGPCPCGSGKKYKKCCRIP